MYSLCVLETFLRVRKNFDYIPKMYHNYTKNLNNPAFTLNALEFNKTKPCYSVITLYDKLP